MSGVVVLSGGVGGARFLEGVRATRPDGTSAVVNTADDAWLFGLRVCPDLDSVMYTLGGGIDRERGWGRSGETWQAKEELAALGSPEAWFGLGDRDLATHLVRTQALRDGTRLTEVTDRLCRRWEPGLRILPMTDTEVESRVTVELDGRQQEIHFQEYWIRHRANLPIRSIRFAGIAAARPSDEIVQAVRNADTILLAPSNPVVSIWPILEVPGMRELVRSASAPVVGVSPIIAGGHVRGMADQLLAGIGVPVSASGVAAHLAARSRDGVLDGWLVDEADTGEVAGIHDLGIACRAVPLYMSDPTRTQRLAEDALALADQLRGGSRWN